MTLARTVPLTISLLAAGAVLACLLELPLIWDGGSQLVVTLFEQKPFVYLTRFHTWFLWWPTVWISRLTDNQSLLLLAYGLPFLLAPAISVGASWWFIRRHCPTLIIWSVFGVAASLPGQSFVINDSIWQQTLAWPLILGALVPLRGWQRIAWLIFGACQFPHHIGVILLGMAFIAAVVARQRWAAMSLALLLCLAAAKAIWVSVPAWSGPYFDSYAAKEASSARMWQTFRTSVVGWTLAGLVPLWAAGAVIAFFPRSSRWPLVLIGATVITWTVYAVVPGEWMSAINYRRWVVPIAAPFALAAIYDARRITLDAHQLAPKVRSTVMLILAVLFVVVIGSQAVAFHRLLGNLRTEVAASPATIVSHSDLACIRGNVLDHWSLTSTFMFLQGRVPSKYIAARESDREAILSSANPRVFLHEGASYPLTPGPAGWFDHRPLLRAGDPGDSPN